MMSEANDFGRVRTARTAGIPDRTVDAPLCTAFLFLCR